MQFISPSRWCPGEVILDSSAIVAVIRREEGHERLAATIGGADGVGVGAPTLLEATLVIGRSNDVQGGRLLAPFLIERGVEVIPFGSRHWSIAAAAHRRYGKGRHPARLNFGDCMAYATAKLAGAPLLFVGEDFLRTDVEAA